MNNSLIYTIKQLQEKTRELSESKENERRSSYWIDDVSNDGYMCHLIPKEKGNVPFTVNVEKVGYNKIWNNFLLTQFYQDPICFVEYSLKIAIHKFETFNDCTPIGKLITYWPGVGFEKSLFGCAQIYSEEDTWIGREDVIKERVAIKSLKYLNFKEMPLMKSTIEFFEKMVNVLDDDFSVQFPQWCRSPWGVAWHLRGINNLLIDIIEDEEWVKGFLNYLLDLRKSYATFRANYLNIDLVPANLFNDEVTSPIISPKIYKDMVWPTEVEISKFFGGMNYWHRCGNTTPYLEYVNEIPDLRMVNISPWTNTEKASEIFDVDKAIEFTLHPYKDVIRPENEKYVRNHLREIREANINRKVTVRADALEIVGNVSDDIKTIQKWVKYANEVLL